MQSRKCNSSTVQLEGSMSSLIQAPLNPWEYQVLPRQPKGVPRQHRHSGIVQPQTTIRKMAATIYSHANQRIILPPGRQRDAATGEALGHLQATTSTLPKTRENISNMIFISSSNILAGCAQPSQAMPWHGLFFEGGVSPSPILTYRHTDTSTHPPHYVLASAKQPAAPLIPP